MATRNELDAVRARIEAKAGEHYKKYLTTEEQRANFIKAVNTPVIGLPYKAFKKRVKAAFPIVPVLKAVHARYLENPDLKAAFNNFFEHGTTENAQARETIDDAVADGRQTIIVNKGKTGLGKSTISMQEQAWIAEAKHASTVFHLDLDNPDDKMRLGDSEKAVHAYFTYNYSGALESLTSTCQNGDTTIMDENQPPHGRGSGKLGDKLIIVIESTTRAASKNFIVNTPREHEFPEVDLVFEVIGINKETRQTLAIMTIPAKKDVKDSHTVLGIVVFDLTLTPELMSWYDLHSKALKKEIEANGGASGAGGLTEAKLEKYSRMFLDKLKQVPEGKYRRFLYDENKSGGMPNMVDFIMGIDIISVLDDDEIKKIIDYAFFPSVSSEDLPETVPIEAPARPEEPWIGLNMGEGEYRGWQLMVTLDPTWPNPLHGGLSPAAIALRDALGSWCRKASRWLDIMRMQQDASARMRAWRDASPAPPGLSDSEIAARELATASGRRGGILRQYGLNVEEDEIQAFFDKVFDYPGLAAISKLRNDLIRLQARVAWQLSHTPEICIEKAMASIFDVERAMDEEREAMRKAIEGPPAAPPAQQVAVTPVPKGVTVQVSNGTWKPDLSQYERGQNSARDIDIYHRFNVNKELQADIGGSLTPPLEISRVSQIVRDVSNWIGETFEDATVGDLRASWRKDEDPAWKCVDPGHDIVKTSIPGLSTPDITVTLRHKVDGRKKVMFYNAKSYFPKGNKKSISVPVGHIDDETNEMRGEIQAARDLHAKEPATVIEVRLRLNEHREGRIFPDEVVDWNVANHPPISFELRKPKKHGHHGTNAVQEL